MNPDCPIAFEDDSHDGVKTFVPVTEFDYSAVDAGDETDSEKFHEVVLGIKSEVVRRLLLYLIAGASQKEAGLRAHLLAYGLKIHPAKTQIDLAASLKISQPTVSRCIKQTSTLSRGFSRFLAERE